MTEQLQHQDPLKPMDNTQMVAQMAQMSTVQGITDLNKTVKGFQESMASDQVLRGAALVGHQVLVPSEKLVLEKEGSVEGTVAAPSAGIITVDITDANGAKVTSLSVEATAAGETAFQWDGKDANGKRMEPQVLHRRQPCRYRRQEHQAVHLRAGAGGERDRRFRRPVPEPQGPGHGPDRLRAPRQLSRTSRINQEHPMGFNVSLSGINAANTDLSVTANNVANVNTTGFKQSRAEFADLFAPPAMACRRTRPARACASPTSPSSSSRATTSRPGAA